MLSKQQENNFPQQRISELELNIKHWKSSDISSRRDTFKAVRSMLEKKY